MTGRRRTVIRVAQKGRIVRAAAMAVAIAVLLSITAGPATARRKFPKHVDPRSWELPEHMRWGDYEPIPGVDWLDPSNRPPKTLRAALILGDFADQGFRVSETTVDPTGQRGLGVDDAAQYWLDYLFYEEDPNAPQRGHTVNEYWLENSYGLIGVDAVAFGPYHLPGKMYDYGVSDFGTAADCPDEGPTACMRDFDAELTAASLLDVTAAQVQEGEFDFRFLLHAGYDESGVWLNYGQAMFPNKESVTDKFGPEDPDHRNWAATRYVDWTSFFSAQQIWSHALPGALSTQGESDGGSTYAHELSHILGVLDNYNDPYGENPKRAFSGPWDMMSRGTFNGPGGPFERNVIPPTKGGTMGSHHMLRNKIRFGFIPPTEVKLVTRPELQTGAVVKARILQRESPPPADKANLFSGIRVALGEDRSNCDASESKCDEGGSDYYDVEVVNRQGFDSFLPDHGVLIAKTKTLDLSPDSWVVDAHPKDIGGGDYVTADGEEVPYTVGDYRQLADATFHAGTARGIKNSYVDEENGVAFYVLKTKVKDGQRIYSVAVKSSAPASAPATIDKVRGRVGPSVSRQVFEVTNPSDSAAVYRLAVEGSRVKTRLLNDLLYLKPGATKEVVVWAKRTGPNPSVDLVAEPR
jgi:M6 family metalloprotease-like protein